MFGLTPVVMWAGIALVVTNLLTVLAWRIEVASHEIDKAKAANIRVEQADAAVKRMNEARKLNDSLVALVASKEAEIKSAKETHREELRKSTAGKPCLSGNSVRLLNAQSGNGGAQAGREPIPAATAAATDTDVAEWAADAIESYEICRGRIDAIREFYNHLSKD